MGKVRWGLFALGSLLACSGREEPGSGIVLLLDTDMAVPASVDEVALYVEKAEQGARRTVLAQRAAPLYDPATQTYSVNFAARLALQADTESAQAGSIRVRFVGFAADGSVLAMREARTTLPQSGVKRLSLPLLFINSGRVVDTEAGANALAGSALELAAVEADERANPFTRFRHPECNDDETLGDDGKCIGIDVDVSALPDFDADEKIACVSAEQCFSGETGVRSLIPDEDCNVHVPAADGNDLAVALRTAVGYAAADRVVQPVASNLYRFDTQSRVLTLLEPLCSRARAGSNEIYVSAKCSPIPAATPVCGPWRTDSPALEQPDGRFLDDASAPPADAADDGDSGDFDAGDGGDGAVPPPPEYRQTDTEVVIDPALEFGYLVSFAAAPVPRQPPATWTWMRKEQDSEPYTVVDHVFHVPSMQAPRTIVGSFERAGLLQVGAGNALYALNPSMGEGIQPRYVLKDGAAAFEALSYFEGGEYVSDLEDSDLTIGVLGGKTLGLHFMNQEGARFVARAPNPANLAQFQAGPVVPLDEGHADSIYGFGRGSVAGDSFWIPAPRFNHNFLRAREVAGQLQLTPHVLLPPGDDESLYGFTFLSMGGAQAVTLVGSGRYRHAIYASPLDASGIPAYGAQLFALEGEDSFDVEAFSGQDTFCVRKLDGYLSFAGIVCGRSQQGELDVFELEVPSLTDVHLYGDADYVYFATACGGFEPQKLNLKVRAVPWSQFDERAQEAVLSLQCPIVG